MNRNRQKIIIAILGIVVAIMIGAIVITIIKNALSDPEETNQGIEIIKEQENADVKSIEAKIVRLEKASSSESGEKSLNERFTNSIVLGDSFAKGFDESGVLDSDNVIASANATTFDADDLLDKAKSKAPQNLFVVLGNQDIVELDGDVNAFEKSCKAMFDDLQESFPKTYIFVNGIFPVKEDALENEPDYEYIDEFNKVLKDLCGDYDITYINNSDLPTNTDYEKDGIHFKSEFYEKWAEYMAEEAVL